MSALLAGMMCGNLDAQPIGQATGGSAGVAATRWVHLYSELELQLQDALASGRSESAQTLLAEDFAARLADGRLLDRADWLRLHSRPVVVWMVSGLAVQHYDEVDVVSFVRTHPKTLQRQWVVDVWRSDGPKLLSRTEASLGWGARPPLPGGDEGFRRPRPPGRPDGKG
jgi:hypothetical protein